MMDNFYDNAVLSGFLSWLDGLEMLRERDGVPELASKLPESGLELVVDRTNLDCESRVSLTGAEFDL